MTFTPKIGEGYYAYILKGGRDIRTFFQIQESRSPIQKLGLVSHT